MTDEEKREVGEMVGEALEENFVNCCWNWEDSGVSNKRYNERGYDREVSCLDFIQIHR